MNSVSGRRISNEQAIKYTTTVATGAGLLTGISEIARQKKIFDNADVLITQMQGQMKRDAMFCNPFHKGSQEAADLALKQLKDNFEKFKAFAEGKKFDFKQIGKAGLIGAGIAAACTTLYCLTYNLGKNETQDNAKILASEFKTAKVGEN